MRRLSSIEFVKKAIMVHNNEYNYDNTKYLKGTEKVIITCREHGDFTQLPFGHLSGSGCSFCANNQQSTKEIFISKARIVHNDKYNYDNVNYINNKTIVMITCPVHGDFPQSPSNHLTGFNCTKCAKEEAKIKLTYDSKMLFETKARKVHFDKYDYQKVEYLSSKTNVIITCKKHGDFKQTPSNHLRGQDCPKCKMSKGEINIKNSLEKLNIKFETQYKFDDCYYKQKLAFDFAIFINGKFGLIEFHGEQHYKMIPFFNKNNKYEESKK